jgi:tRNA-2-methylthio-N6-dimethylallyladenosine synthase
VEDGVFGAIRDLPGVCAYLHMPAQSGSDAVLARMKRGYTRSEYLDKVERMREIAPQTSIAGDFIVGFPGETDADFEETADLLRRVGYKNSFIFKYSPRPATAAAKFDDDVPPREKARRNNELLSVQKEVSLAHNASFVGRETRVYVEAAGKRDGQLSARTEGDEVVIVDGDDELLGGFVRVRITDATAVSLFGEIISQG